MPTIQHPSPEAIARVLAGTQMAYIATREARRKHAAWARSMGLTSQAIANAMGISKTAADHLINTGTILENAA